MSMAYCHECGRLIDTDDDPGAYFELLGIDKVICEACRDRLGISEFEDDE